MLYRMDKMDKMNRIEWMNEWMCKMNRMDSMNRMCNNKIILYYII